MNKSPLTSEAMLARVRSMAEEIIQHEGGLVDHKNDRGGITNYGISLRYARGIGLDLDGDGDTDKDDIILVTPEKAIELYMEDFYWRPRINRMPLILQPQLFDIAVNSGPVIPVLLLQRAVNRYAVTKPLIEDGVYGPKTRRGMEAVTQQFGLVNLNDEIVQERIQFYQQIVKRDRDQRIFLDGWLKRAKSFYMEVGA
jgi:lysozyme family protein